MIGACAHSRSRSQSRHRSTTTTRNMSINSSVRGGPKQSDSIGALPRVRPIIDFADQEHVWQVCESVERQLRDVSPRTQVHACLAAVERGSWADRCLSDATSRHHISDMRRVEDLFDIWAAALPRPVSEADCLVDLVELRQRRGVSVIAFAGAFERAARRAGYSTNSRFALCRDLFRTALRPEIRRCVAVHALPTSWEKLVDVCADHEEWLQDDDDQRHQTSSVASSSVPQKHSRRRSDTYSLSSDEVLESYLSDVLSDDDHSDAGSFRDTTCDDSHQTQQHQQQQPTPPTNTRQPLPFPDLRSVITAATASTETPTHFPTPPPLSSSSPRHHQHPHRDHAMAMFKSALVHQPREDRRPMLHCDIHGPNVSHATPKCRIAQDAINGGPEAIAAAVAVAAAAAARQASTQYRGGHNRKGESSQHREERRRRSRLAELARVAAGLE